MKDWRIDEPSGGYTGKIVDGSGNTIAIVNNFHDAVYIDHAVRFMDTFRSRFEDDPELQKAFLNSLEKAWENQ